MGNIKKIYKKSFNSTEYISSYFSHLSEIISKIDHAAIAKVF